MEGKILRVRNSLGARQEVAPEVGMIVHHQDDPNDKYWVEEVYSETHEMVLRAHRPLATGAQPLQPKRYRREPITPEWINDHD